MNEIDEQIKLAIETKNRFGYTDKITVHKRWVNKRRFVIGFNFKQGVNVGDVYLDDDGSTVEVLAIV